MACLTHMTCVHVHVTLAHIYTLMHGENPYKSILYVIPMWFPAFLKEEVRVTMPQAYHKQVPLENPWHILPCTYHPTMGTEGGRGYMYMHVHMRTGAHAQGLLHVVNKCWSREPQIARTLNKDLQLDSIWSPLSAVAFIRPWRYFDLFVESYTL